MNRHIRLQLNSMSTLSPLSLKAWNDDALKALNNFSKFPVIMLYSRHEKLSIGIHGTINYQLSFTSKASGSDVLALCFFICFPYPDDSENAGAMVSW